MSEKEMRAMWLYLIICVRGLWDTCKTPETDADRLNGTSTG